MWCHIKLKSWLLNPLLTVTKPPRLFKCCGDVYFALAGYEVFVTFPTVIRDAAKLAATFEKQWLLAILYLASLIVICPHSHSIRSPAPLAPGFQSHLKSGRQLLRAGGRPRVTEQVPVARRQRLPARRRADRCLLPRHELSVQVVGALQHTAAEHRVFDRGSGDQGWDSLCGFWRVALLRLWALFPVHSERFYCSHLHNRYGVQFNTQDTLWFNIGPCLLVLAVVR